VSIVLQPATGRAVNTKTDSSGNFKLNVSDGVYTLNVEHAGFTDHQQQITMAGAAFLLSIEIAEIREVQEVTARSTLGGSDPLYRSSRDATLKESFVVENVVLKRDVGALTFKRGTITFGSPLGDKVTMSVFVGDGVLSLKPVPPIEARYLQGIIGSAAVEEPFERALLIFSDGTADELRKTEGASVSEPRAQDVLSNLRRRFRQRTEEPRSMIEYMLEGESMANVDADIVADLYNPKRSGFFSAYIDGRHYHDLRFHVNHRGVFADLPSPEEVALIHLSPGGATEGIWYLGHLATEYEQQTANSHEDKRVAAAEHYRIETVIGNNDRLTSVAAALEAGQEISFVQQSRREDGSFLCNHALCHESGQ
jgi:hypothetical protein